MNNCLGLLPFDGNIFTYDNCRHVISYNVNELDNFTRESLVQLSQSCFDAYKYRLEAHSDKMNNIGKEEYKLINEKLISTILPFNPLKFSFSISHDPSLHFVVRFVDNVSLIVETYLDLKDGHDTFIYIYGPDYLILNKNCSFDQSLFEINNKLKNVLASKEPAYDGLMQFKKLCL